MRLVLLLTAVLLQAASFDAASIKRSDSPPGSSGIDTDIGLLRGHNVTLKRCISGAYGIPEAQILGGPKWIGEQRYEIVARTQEHLGDQGLMELLQTLLADRFRLVLHHETQLVSGYALTVAKSGLKATPSDPDARSSTNSSRTGIDAKGATMVRLAMKLSAALGQPVTDATGIDGKFDLSLKWVPDEMAAKGTGSTATDQGPSLFTALQEQVGLKLEARKMPVDVVVIDQAEPPSEN